MSPGKAVRRMFAWLLGYPPRRDRKAAIAEARAAREKARWQAGRAKQTAADIKRIAYEDDHFASNIIGTLRSQRGGGGSDPGPARR